MLETKKLVSNYECCQNRLWSHDRRRDRNATIIIIIKMLILKYETI